MGWALFGLFAAGAVEHGLGSAAEVRMVALAWLTPTAIAWGFSVRFFWKAGAWLPYFVLGSAGAAFLLIVGMREVVPGEDMLRAATAFMVDRTAWVAGVHTTVTDASSGDLLVVGVPHHNEWTLLTIGIECSGLLELATLFGLVAFFPALNRASAWACLAWRCS